MSSFILEVVAKHAEPSKRLCNKVIRFFNFWVNFGLIVMVLETSNQKSKTTFFRQIIKVVYCYPKKIWNDRAILSLFQDPFTLKSGVYLRHLFPNSRFLFMIRDGRATVHSIISRKVTITGFDLSSYRQSLSKWDGVITAMNLQCDEINKLHPNRCMKVYYEQLVRKISLNNPKVRGSFYRIEILNILSPDSFLGVRDSKVWHSFYRIEIGNILSPDLFLLYFSLVDDKKHYSIHFIPDSWKKSVRRNDIFNYCTFY